MRTHQPKRSMLRQQSLALFDPFRDLASGSPFAGQGIPIDPPLNRFLCRQLSGPVTMSVVSVSTSNAEAVAAREPVGAPRGWAAALGEPAGVRFFLMMPAPRAAAQDRSAPTSVRSQAPPGPLGRQERRSGAQKICKKIPDIFCQQGIGLGDQFRRTASATKQIKHLRNCISERTVSLGSHLGVSFAIRARLGPAMFRDRVWDQATLTINSGKSCRGERR